MSGQDPRWVASMRMLPPGSIAWSRALRVWGMHAIPVHDQETCERYRRGARALRDLAINERDPEAVCLWDAVLMEWTT